MNKTDYISALTNIDDCFVEEAAFSTKSAYVNKRKLVLLVAAAAMSLILVACSILVANSEVFTTNTPIAEVEHRIESLNEPLTIDGYLGRLSEIMAEYKISEEDIVVKTYDEYIRNGYYFDESILVTKDTVIGRIVTDAENYTFDIELIGFFYNKKTDEFKTISEKTTAPGGKIEIIMNSERGWESFGGILRRTHPETEYNGYYGIHILKYGIEPSIRAMQYMDKYYDEMYDNSVYRDLSKIGDIATVKITWDTNRDAEIFATAESDNPIARIEQIASAYEMDGITNGTFSYDKQTTLNGQFIEIGYAYDENRFITFFNNTIEEATLEDWVFNIILYNTEKDQYRVIDRHYCDYTSFVLPIETTENWKFLGVCMYRSKPESDVYEFVDYCDFTPVKDDELDSQKFIERIKMETEQSKQSTIRIREDRIKRKSKDK